MKEDIILLYLYGYANALQFIDRAKGDGFLMLVRNLENAIDANSIDAPQKAAELNAFAIGHGDRNLKDVIHALLEEL